MTDSTAALLRPLSLAARRVASILVVALLCPFPLAWAVSQAQAQIAGPATPAVAGSEPGTRSKPPAVKVAAGPKAEAKPAWADLSVPQRQALAPLAGTWSTLTEAHKRKWIALSENYPNLPPPEQARVHSRMADWAALTPQQRTQARLNFAETKKVPPQDKKAMWDAYQALPPEEKRKLAAGAAVSKPAPPPTAVAVQPVPQQKLAKVPKSRSQDPRSPRIAVAPKQLDQNTLLPQPGSAAGP